MRWLWVALSSGALFACGGQGSPAPAGSATRVQREEAHHAVHFDSWGVPTIKEATRERALEVLGYVTARDRMFQMDLLRRRMAGRLAELFGPAALESDLAQRNYGFEGVARRVLERLPASQRDALEAYARGVNSWLGVSRLDSIEFEVLEYQPEPWRSEDSVLVVLGMFQGLGGTEEQERTRTVLARSLPPEVAQFFGAAGSGLPGTRNSEDLPLQGLLRSLGSRAPRRSARVSLHAGEARRGSNAWAIAGSRTRDGRAILANDMHLDLGVPNLWYRAALEYEGRRLDGAVLPGTPALIVGSNHDVAWGLTSLEADVLDLVELDVDPSRPDFYRTTSGWESFESREELMRVRGGGDVRFEARSTIWGPVALTPLLGRPVAVRWTALDPSAVDLALLDMDAATGVEDAVALLTRAAGPACNVLLADHDGNIAWTVTGRIPRRVGFDGAQASSWTSGERSWGGYLEPAQLPRSVNPVEGLLVNANQAMAEAATAPVLSHDYARGERTARIRELLLADGEQDEGASLQIQLDTRAASYEIYRRAALGALEAAEGPRSDPALLERARRALLAWDGHAEVSSRGFALVTRLRRRLAEELLSPWISICQEKSPDFEFTLDVDGPLERLLTERPRELAFLLGGDWDAGLVALLARTAEELEATFSGSGVDELEWGRVNRVRMLHPLGALPGLSALNLEEDPLPGCGFCVRVANGTLGVTQRLVVSPGREDDGIFHMPAGQSGDVASPHYRDQQRAWITGARTPLLPGTPASTLTIESRTRRHHGK